MKVLSEEVIYFLKKQSYVIVSTISEDGTIQNACKGLVKVSEDGRVYLLDLYLGATYRNLKENPHISLTAADEHSFSGYCLKGKAKLIPREELSGDIIKSWEEAIVSRLTSRLLRNIRGEKGHSAHPEALLPKPKYMIMVEVDDVVDLTPKHLK